MMVAMRMMPAVVLFLLLAILGSVEGRPVVRNIRSAHEFDRLLQKHATETGLPVVVDFYSDSCGPCRMMAPIFKQVASAYTDKAVFVKVDTNAQYELSSRYQVRSLPTFMYFLNGKKVNQALGGIGEAALRQQTDQLVRQADIENVVLSLTALQEYYTSVDATKAQSDIAAVHQKCADMTKGAKECVGAAANQLVRRLKTKYKTPPKTSVRFTEQDRKSDSSSGGGGANSKPSHSSKQEKTFSNAPNLHLATKDQLLEELERRLDQERDAQVEDEDELEDEADPDFTPWQQSTAFPERTIIIGGGPAGMAAAIYAARAGLRPLVLAPTMGGQLQGKGVDVENYPGLHNVTGPAVIAAMRKQAAHFGAFLEDDLVVKIDASTRPLKVSTNSSLTIETHTIIVATGAEANWLNVPGEYEMRGGGVSSCATCDGFLYSGQHVVVVGGGDGAMEDALVLARTSRAVTIVHRRDAFHRASKILADRVLQHPLITVQWNTVVKEILGKDVQIGGGDDDAEQDLDSLQRVVSGVRLENTQTGEMTMVDCDAVFVAIGHTPATSFLSGVVDFDPNHPGYLWTNGYSTQTSVPGIYAAGDVADSVYRQAITSAGSGAAAALDAERYLSEHGLGNEEALMEAELLAELMAMDSSSSSSRSGNDVYNVYDDAGGRMAGMKESLAAEL